LSPGGGGRASTGAAVGGEDATDDVLDAARDELVRAAEDLERLTDELHDRSRQVERLEVLAEALLDLVATPAIVVDSSGLLSGLSRGAASSFPALADGLGKPAAPQLPAELAGDLVATTSDGSSREHHLSSGSTFVPLPDGSTLVVMGR
jgi:ABC-type transporter Mla subunit MlaD